MNNAVMFNGNTDGIYLWRVDCVVKRPESIKEGKTWKFTVNATP